MSIRQAATRATTDTLNVVSAVTTTVSQTTMMAADFAAAGRLHSQAYYQRTEASLRLTENEIQVNAEDDAKRRMVRRMISLDEELKDPTFAKYYNSIDFSKPDALKSVA